MWLWKPDAKRRSHVGAKGADFFTLELKLFSRSVTIQPWRVLYCSRGNRVKKILDIAEATASLADYAQDASCDPVIVRREGKPIAALMPIENVDWETIRLSTHPKFLTLIERSRGDRKRKGAYRVGR